MTSIPSSTGRAVQDSAHYLTQPCGHPTASIERATYGPGSVHWCGDCRREGKFNDEPDSCCGLPSCPDCRPENFTPKEATNG